MRENFAENLKIKIQDKNLTYAELARQLKVSRQAVVSWVNAYNYPTLGMLHKIAEILDEDVTELLK